jgi:hypothetical protein
MLDARGNVICTSAHIGKSLVPLAYSKRRTLAATSVASGLMVARFTLPWRNTRGCLPGCGRFSTNPGLISWSLAQVLDSACDHSAVLSMGCSGASLVQFRPLATSQPSTDFYTRLQKPCFIGLYCIPLSADVPSDHPQLPVSGGCFKVTRKKIRAGAMRLNDTAIRHRKPGPPDRSTVRGTEHAASPLIHG